MEALLKRAAQIRKEVDLSTYIPYTSHVTRNVIKLGDSGNYVAVIRMQGAAHETADARDINIWHNQLNQFLRNVASPNVALWSHTIRREVHDFPGGEFAPGFARALNEKYRDTMRNERMLVNELYLTIVFRPQPVSTLRFLDMLTTKSPAELREKQLDELQTMDDLIMSSLASLDRYSPELLGCYEHKGVMYSEPLEFLGFLLNGEWRKVAVPRAEIRNVLATSRPFFGKGGLLSIKGPTSIQYGAMLAIVEYPTPTCPGLLNGLLCMPFELVISQSFTFLSKNTAKGRMSRQQARMINAGDLAESQIQAIDEAMDELISNQWVMGAHAISILIRADKVKRLNEHIAVAGSSLSDSGIKWVREDIALTSAYFSQLPGNFRYRVSTGDINSRNYAGFSSFHNFPAGRIRNNQWGDAVTMLKTTSEAPYFFNFHAQEEGAEAKKTAKLDPNHKDIATTLICGPSGSGKTALMAFLLAQTQKFAQFPSNYTGVRKLTCVVFDKDLGAAIAVRAMGGRYYPIRNGIPTGWNPFQLEPSPNNMLFLEKFVKQLVTRIGWPVTPAQERQIHEGVAGVMAAAKAKRHLGAVLEFLTDHGDENGIHARLSRWCRGGPNAWLFDNREDTLSVEDCPIVGFDVTDFLENDETRTPTVMYLFHRVKSLLDGRRMPIFMDEFPTMLNDEAFSDFVDKEVVTIRKKDGFLVLFCQFPKQILDHRISSALVSQSATKIFLPNPEADYDDYVNGFKLTSREYEIIKDLAPKSRRFLIKQGGNSVVAELNLRGYADELAVLSGNTATSALVERLVAELGDSPDIWLPEYHRIRKGISS